METSAKVYSFKPSIAQMVDDYMKKTGINVTDFAKKIGFSHSAVSQYIGGKYSSNPVNIEKAMFKVLKDEGFIDTDIEINPSVKERPEFFLTKDASGIVGVCQSCQEFRGLGTIVGRSGFGKTFTVRQYAKSENVCYIECDDGMCSSDLIEAIEENLGLPHITGTISKRLKHILEFFNVNLGYLLIIDEADKLLNNSTQKKMEILRAIYDKSTVGLVIAGEPKLETMIKSYLPRFANRVDFYYSLQGMTRKEVEVYLEGYKFTQEAFEEMVNRATNSRTGCFRLLNRTLKNILRIIPENIEITWDTIKQASSMMML